MRAVGRSTTSVSTSRGSPITSPAPARLETTRSSPVFSPSQTLAQPSPHTGNDVAIQTLTTLQFDIQHLIRDNDLLHERKSPRDNVMDILDAAARNLRRTPPANTSNVQLRPNTSSQRKAQPLFTTYLPDIRTHYNSPERKISKQWDAKRIKVSTRKRKMPHQK